MQSQLFAIIDVETTGGGIAGNRITEICIALLKDGIIQKKIKESAEKEQQLFDSGELKLLGTNYHPNKNDRMKGDLELFPFVKHNPTKTLIAPIVEKRLSEITEQERLKTES